MHEITGEILMQNFCYGQPSTDHEPDLVAISKEFPLIGHPKTHELEVVAKVMEQGPKAHMPLTWFMEAPVPAAAKGRNETEKSNTLVGGRTEASPDRLRNISEILGASAAPAPNMLGLGYGNLAALSNMHQVGATRGSMLGSLCHNNRDLSTLSSINPMIATPTVQRPDAALLRPNVDVTELIVARSRASEAVDANMSALAAVRHRANEAVAKLQAIQKAEIAMRLAQQDQIIAAYRANCNAGYGMSAPTGQVAAAQSALAMQNHIRALAASMANSSEQEEVTRRSLSEDAKNPASKGPQTGRS